MDSDFYSQRHLPVPTRELRPQSPEQLTQMLADVESAGQSWRLVGDGQHARIGDESADADQQTVIRTDGLDGVIEFDEHSGLIRVQAGIRWKQLAAAVGERQFSLQRYGLHPATATVGGILARRRPGPPNFRCGALLNGCVAIGARDTQVGDYRYLAAPRKASGPDLRHEFIGAGDSNGAIVDVTLVAWRPVDSRLVRYDDCSLGDAAKIVRIMSEAAITPTWIHYAHNAQSLQFELAMPGRLLRARINWLADRLGAPDDTGDTEDARIRRRWLEARHPDRRTHPAAERTRVFWVTPSAFGQDPTELFGSGVVDVEVASWTPRRATAYVRYDDVADARRKSAGYPICDDALWATWPLICRDPGN